MMRCIAIDDEPLALQQMAGYIEKTPFLKLAGQFESALQAMTWLQDNQVELMFVDINMPDLNGMDFVKSMKNPPGVIFTTAYSEYALEGFRVDAIDYLLKPIGYGDFLKGAEKAVERIGATEKAAPIVESDENFLFVKSEYKILRINLSDIKYIEGMREYVRIHIENQRPVMALMSMKKIEAFLPRQKFMRVHRSYVVNLEKVNAIERHRIIFESDIRIPISEQYKAAFQEFLDKNFLL